MQPCDHGVLEYAIFICKSVSYITKEIGKVRETARIYDDDSLDFTPQKEGNPVRKDVKKVRKSTFYTTIGEKADYDLGVAKWWNVERRENPQQPFS